MSPWRFRITPEGEEDLDDLDKNFQKRVIEKLMWLAENFDKVTPLPLGGQWRGFFNSRVGDWRIIYEVDNENKEIIVHIIDRREKIYKRKK